MEHQHRLLVGALEGSKPHGGPHQGLGNGFGIGRIMFVAFQKWADIVWGDQSHLVPLGAELSGPIVGTATGFPPNQAGR
jgi:hypothetical protein